MEVLPATPPNSILASFLLLLVVVVLLLAVVVVHNVLRTYMSYKSSNFRRGQTLHDSSSGGASPQVRQLQELFPSWSEEGMFFIDFFAHRSRRQQRRMTSCFV